MDHIGLLESLQTIVRETDVNEAAIIARSVQAWMKRFTDNKITVTKNWRTIDATVYMIKGRRSVGFEISDITPETLEKAVSNSMKLIKYAPEQVQKPTLFGGSCDYEDKNLAYDPKIPDLRDRAVDLIEEALNAASREGAEKSSGTIVFGESGKSIATTTGCEGEERSTFVEFSIRSFYDEESTGQSVRSSSTLSNLNFSDIGEEAGKTAYQARNSREGKSSVYQVAFKPYAIANLINTVAESSSAYLADIGLSYLKDKLGKRVASDVFNLTDDPKNASSSITSLFDDEGRPTRAVKIIENGQFKSFLHTTKTAEKHGAEPTGNSYFSTSVGDMVPAPRSLDVDPGDMSEDELIEELGNGILISNVWYTRFQNYLTGDFSTIPRDGVFEVKRGETSGALKGLRVSDNTLNLLSAIKAFSRKRIWVKWWEVDIPVLVSSCSARQVRLTKPTK